jgi:hypothetical protein
MQPKPKHGAALTVVAAALLALLLAAGCGDDTATAPAAAGDQLTDAELLDPYAKVGVDEFSPDRADRWDRLAERLDLTDEQLAQLQLAFAELHDGLQELHELYAAGELTRDELCEQVALLEDAFELALQEILSEEQLDLLEQLRAQHRQQHRIMGCFRLVLPVTFVMPDGTTIVVEDRADHAEIRAWYEANPEVTDRPELQYPVDIVYRDGEIVTIDDADAMAAARDDCHSDDHGGGGHGGDGGHGGNGGGGMGGDGMGGDGHGGSHGG